MLRWSRFGGGHGRRLVIDEKISIRLEIVRCIAVGGGGHVLWAFGRRGAWGAGVGGKGGIGACGRRLAGTGKWRWARGLAIAVGRAGWRSRGGRVIRWLAPVRVRLPRPGGCAVERLFCGGRW